MKNLQPAIHRQWIKEGKMTEEESNQIVWAWEIRNKIERDTGELIEDMGIEENVEDWAMEHGANYDRDGWTA